VWCRAPADLVVVAHVAFIVFIAVDSLVAGTLSVDELDLGAGAGLRTHWSNRCAWRLRSSGQCDACATETGPMPPMSS